MSDSTTPPTPGQRWVSRTEPELGLGTILEMDGRSVVVHFPSAETTRRYAGRDAPLRRVRFHPGDRIEARDGQTFVVEDVDEVDGLLVYRGKGRELLETSLSDESRFNDPSERLVAGDTDPTAAFDLRVRALVEMAQIVSSDHRGFVGGRVDLMPHQLYVAQEVAKRHAPRVLLADEPGLGKTIEACLILHQMLLSGRAERVLIVVPEQLVPQWMVELRRRFNLTFAVYDEARCAALEEADPETPETPETPEAPEANPFTDDQLVLCGIETLREARRGAQAVEAGWDMVVVDEAHHLHWEPSAASPEYLVIEALAEVSDGLLLITATPEQLGKAGHFARLRLLDRERYPSFEAFLEEPKQHPQVVELAEQLIAGEPLNADAIDTLRAMLSHDAEALESDLSSLTAGSAEAGGRWAGSLLDLYGPGRVMLRNTRAAMSGFPARVVHLTPLAATSDAHLAAVSHELLHELSGELSGELSSEESPLEFDYEMDPRVDWLLEKLEAAPDDKVLLICTTTRKCLAIEAALRRRKKVHAAVFHEELTIIQRDRNAAWFADTSGAQLLICSEIGSEGRNFQFAHHLVLFDLPVDPDLLEQRIGRLERIGQRHDIHIHVLYLEGTAQEVLVRWLHEGVRAIDRTTSAGSNFLEQFGERVTELAANAASGTGDPGEVQRLIDDTKRYRTEVADALERGRDRMIELTSFRPGASAALIAAVEDEDESASLEGFFIELMEHLGVYSEETLPRSYLLNPDSLSTENFPKLSPGDTRISFDRATALSRWDVEFVTMDSPLLQKALDTMLLSGEGNSAFALWEDDDQAGMLLEAVYVVETLAPLNLHIERFLETTPLRLIVDHNNEELSERLSPEFLHGVLSDADPAWLIANQQAIRQLLPRMLRRVRTMAQQRLPERIDEARGAATSRPDLTRLHTLMRVNSHVRSDEVERAEAEVAQVAHHIEGARLRLQALRLIWRGPCEDGRPRLG